ncbi:hypothetical protein LTR70_007374 [Exophiala xenobiotica]|uniref:NACHT domain-containing protein n=1 Tax=Lithohypha guttulata TaxID=1690604 RepID=A0ABR0K6H7_9EURO|nr:hypothetical protein LTR24_006897 [Lithohypha guttulata]KAK5313952.1 hypothetical protein LTR70_007374 [Exophiala xenobiotica]
MSGAPGDASSVGAATKSPVPIRDAGFTLLHDGGVRPEFDIVLIHGIQGHPIDTWTFNSAVEVQPTKPKKILGFERSKSSTPSRAQSDSRSATPRVVPPGMWPASSLNNDFPSARIMTYGYDSRVSNFFRGGTNQNDMITIANGFLNDLAAERAVARGRPLMIISHSMGGLITKEALRRASVALNKDDDLRDVYTSTFALIFFGTPHRGGAYTNLGLTATKIAKAAGFSVNDRNIRDLKGNSPVLTLIREGFAQLLDSDNFEVSTFQESLGYSGVGLVDDKIVPNESSEIGHVRNERKNFINANHMNMCRFKDKNDDGYKKTRAEIQRHLNRLRLRAAQGDNIGEAQSCFDSLRISQMGHRVLQIEPAYEDTLNWLFEEPGPGLAEWLRSGTGVFWIQGKAGSGKSTAMKFLLTNAKTLQLLDQSLPTGKWHLIGSFFTDRAERIQSSWNGILHSMIEQLLQQCPHSFLKGMTQTAYNGLSGGVWDTETLENLLLAFKTRFDEELRVCFLIDALDEHDGQHDRMAKFLHELANTSSTFVRMKICVASRPHNDLKDLFDGDLTLKIQDWTKEDIHLLVTGRLSEQPRWVNLKKVSDGSITRMIEEEIAERAQGVFLWVRLVVSEIIAGVRDGLSLAELQDEVSKFPDDLDEFFDHMLKRVDKKYHLETIIIVETILRSSTAPTPEYLLLVLLANTKVASRTEIGSSESITRAALDNDGFVRRLQSRCGGLVEIVPIGGHTGDWSWNTESYPKHIVQFIHQTVKEYFLERQNLDELLVSATFLAPGVEQANGHFFELQAYAFWLQMEPRDRKGFHVNITTLPEKIIDLASKIELMPSVSSSHLLHSLDKLMSRNSDDGLLWPILVNGDKPCQFLNNPKPFRQGQALLIRATSKRMSRYTEEHLDRDMKLSICASGIIQFGYLDCSKICSENEPLLEGMRLLLNCGIEAKSLQKFTVNAETVLLDTLGVFISSHIDCGWSEDADTIDDHVIIMRKLLSLGADPCGYCVKEGFGPVHIAERFLASIKILNLLWEECNSRSRTITDLFGKPPNKLLELPLSAKSARSGVFKWYVDHGGIISTTIAEKLYEPLRAGFQHQYGTTQSYCDFVRNYTLSQWEMLEPSLINTYIYEMGRDSSAAHRCLLEKQFRHPKYYDAEALRMASQFNPGWGPVELDFIAQKDPPIPPVRPTVALPTSPRIQNLGRSWFSKILGWKE